MSVRDRAADDKFVTLFVKKGYSLVSERLQPYPASCDMADLIYITVNLLNMA